MNKLQLKTTAAELLTLMCVLFAATASSAETAEPAAPPSPPKRYLSQPPDVRHLANITEIMVVLKPVKRTYVNIHYDWGNGKKESRREEASLSSEEVRNLSKAAGVVLRLKQVSSSAIRVVIDGATMNAVEARKFSQVDGLELVEPISFRSHMQ